MSDESLTIREIQAGDLDELLALYLHLHPQDSTTRNEKVEAVWEQMLTAPYYHCFVGTINEQLVTSCILLIIPNLTRGTRPYALIENVVTHSDFRKRGYGSILIKHALSVAWAQDCYKVMLLTGTKEDSTLRFYEYLGFSRHDKKGFVARPT